MKKNERILFVAFTLLCGMMSRQEIRAQGGIVFDWVTTGVIDSNAPYASGGTSTKDVAVDNAGFVYTVGSIGQRLNWGGSPLKPNIINLNGQLGQASFISKSDAQGNTIWAKNYSDSLKSVTSWGTAVATDNQGHLYVGIQFQSNITIGTSRFVTNYNTGTASSKDALLIKMDTSGQVIWIRHIWTSRWRTTTLQTDVIINEISIDDQDNIYIIGEGQGIIAIDTNYISGPYISNAGFMAKYDPNGNCLWANGVFGTVNNSYPTGTSIKPDNEGGVYIHGGYKDSIKIDNTMLKSNGSYRSAYFAKLNAENGRLMWVKAIGKAPAYIGWLGATDPIREGKMTYDGLGHLIINGLLYAGKMDFDPSDNPADTFYLRRSPTDTATSWLAEGAGFVLKLDTTGKFIWAKAFQSVRGGGIGGYNYPITTDQFGYIYTSGLMESTYNVRDTDPVGIDFDPGTDTFMVYSPTHRNPSFITKLDPEGNLRYVKTFGATVANTLTNLRYHASITSLAITPDGQNIYSTGNFMAGAVIDFDPGSDLFIVNMSYIAPNASLNSIFLHKISCMVDTNAATIDTATDCNGVTINGQTFTTEGIHEAVFHNFFGCDSIVKINLTLLLPDPVINVDVDTLSTTQTYASYQWLKDGVIISGATGARYVVTENGNYQVVVTDETGCSDTSDIYPVTNKTGIANTLATKIRIFPNPAENMIYIESPVAVQAVLAGLDGRILVSSPKDAVVHQVSVKELASGIYFLNIRDNKGNLIRVEKVVKR